MNKSIKDFIEKAKMNWIATSVIIIVIFFIYWVLVRPQALLSSEQDKYLLLESFNQSGIEQIVKVEFTALLVHS